MAAELYFIIIVVAASTLLSKKVLAYYRSPRLPLAENGYCIMHIAYMFMINKFMDKMMILHFKSVECL